jgi:hypothetical protein
MSLHLVTQRGQPYGSVLQCCEICGFSVYVEDIGEAFTDNEKRYSDSPFSCNKTQKRNRTPA